MKKSYKDGTHNFSAHFTFYEYFATVIFPSLDISFQNHLRVHYRNHGFLHLNTFISQEQRILLPYDNSGVTLRKLIIGLGMMFQGSVFSGLSPQFHNLPNWISLGIYLLVPLSSDALCSLYFFLAQDQNEDCSLCLDVMSPLVP